MSWFNFQKDNKKENIAHHCIKVLKKSYEKLRRNGRDSSSFPKYLLLDNKIDEDTLIEIRMVYTDLEHVFGPHRETSHYKSYDDFITLHMNAWVSHDYVPGDDKSVPWMKYVPGENHYIQRRKHSRTLW